MKHWRENRDPYLWWDVKEGVTLAVVVRRFQASQWAVDVVTAVATGCLTLFERAVVPSCWWGSVKDEKAILPIVHQDSM